jgi:hypothetical protein
MRFGEASGRATAVRTVVGGFSVPRRSVLLAVRRPWQLPARPRSVHRALANHVLQLTPLRVLDLWRVTFAAQLSTSVRARCAGQSLDVRAGAATAVRFVWVLLSTRAGGGFGRSASRSGLAGRSVKAVSRLPPPARRPEKLWPMPGSPRHCHLRHAVRRGKRAGYGSWDGGRQVLGAGTFTPSRCDNGCGSFPPARVRSTGRSLTTCCS